MSTVDKKIADAVIDGKYPTDGWVGIVKYTNAWGGEAYKLLRRGDPPLMPSPFIINPEIYWEKKDA